MLDLFGTQSETRTFYRTDKAALLEVKTTELARHVFMLSRNILVNQRSVYTYFDLMADIGGFNDSLALLAEFVMFIASFFTTFNDLHKSLISRIFMLQKKLPAKRIDLLDHLRHRKKAKAGACRQMSCHCDTKAKKILELGEKSIARELDLANFIKLQKQVRAMITTLFTPAQQVLLRHNRRLVISHFSTTESDSTPELEPVRIYE